MTDTRPASSTKPLAMIGLTPSTTMPFPVLLVYSAASLIFLPAGAARAGPVHSHHDCTAPMTEAHDPAAVVQRQLDAYNARDLDAILAVYAPDAQQFEHPGKLAASGADQIRERMAQRFQEPDLYAHLLQRVVMGNLVIDQELLTRNFPEGIGTVDVIAIYEVTGDKIRSATVQVSNKQLRPQPTNPAPTGSTKNVASPGE